MDGRESRETERREQARAREALARQRRDHDGVEQPDQRGGQQPLQHGRRAPRAGRERLGRHPQPAGGDMERLPERPVAAQHGRMAGAGQFDEQAGQPAARGDDAGVVDHDQQRGIEQDGRQAGARRGAGWPRTDAA
ncbi:hypothetical protein [Burkholderia plantarii]|uniref:hypothetical protein n=1 Tax=Burkholderia plantarii TaxID=41899 RepID=UPI0011E0290B|nr:hypothetical protein [Burkholderia plantarii]